MTLNQLTYFCRIVECRTINQAAKELFVSQPSISHALRELENELGYELLIRSKQGAVPTEIGYRVYEDARRMLAELDESKAEWARIHEEMQMLSGTVRIAALPSAYDVIYEILIPQLSHDFPNITCLVSELVRENIFGRMNSSEIDLFVGNYALIDEGFLTKAKALRLRVFPLLRDELKLGISAKNPLSKKEYLTPKDTRELTYVLIATGDIISTPYYLPNFRNPPLLMTSYERMKQAVASGQGLGALPERISRFGALFPDGRDIVKYMTMENVHLPIIHFMACSADKQLNDDTLQVMYMMRSAFMQFALPEDEPLEEEICF